VAAFAPLGWYPVAIVTFAWLIHACAEAPPRRAFVHGFSFGLGLFLAGVSWIYVSMHDIGGMPAALAALTTFAFCAFLALFPAAACWLQARIPAPMALRVCLLIPASWTLFEWLRSWILTGFPWLSLGYAAVGWPLQGYGPLLGAFAMSFVSFSLSGTLWLLVRQRDWRPLAAALACVVTGALLQRVNWTSAEGEPLTVALLQGNIEQSLKFDPKRYAETLETYARLAEETQARLIVFPETAVPRFLDQVDPAYLTRLEEVAHRNRGDLLLGVPTRDSRNEYYNGVLAFGSSPPQVYLKVHLVPLGEFVPPGFGWMLRLVNIPMSDFSSGSDEQPVIDAAGQRIAVNVCYEDAFGEEIARRLPAASLLVNVSNVAWFGDSLAPGQHLQIARMRAIETGRMYLTAANTGITAAIDRDGRVTARLPQFTRARLETSARGYSGATPYARWRDWPVVLFCVGILAALALRARTSR